jgi:hypothetical protein
MGFELMAETLKKQKMNQTTVENLFSFFGKNLLNEIDISTDFIWNAFNVHNIDVDYNKQYDKIFEIKGLPIFFIFNDSILIDYRFRYSNRKFLESYLRYGGDFPLTN